MSTFIVPVNNPNTITADGQTVDITNWLTNFNTIYNFVNNSLVAQFNLMNYAGDLITNNGSSISVLTTNGVTNGYVLSKNSAAADGIQWISPPGLPTTTEGDMIYYSSGSNARLPIGASGTFLGSNGSDPSWMSAPGLPIGSIIMWSNSISSIPTGWALCDGNIHNGIQTPNMQGLFPLGAGNVSPPATGGMGLMNPGGPNGDNSSGAGVGAIYTSGNASLQVVAGNGSVAAVANTATFPVGPITPKYYALCFIMYVG
jgi:hypothetical protein